MLILSSAMFSFPMTNASSLPETSPLERKKCFNTLAFLLHGSLLVWLLEHARQLSNTPNREFSLENLSLQDSSSKLNLSSVWLSSSLTSFFACRSQDCTIADRSRLGALPWLRLNAPRIVARLRPSLEMSWVATVSCFKI